MAGSSMNKVSVNEVSIDEVSIEQEQPLLRTFVELADTLTDDYDLADFLHRLTVHCTNLFDAPCAGLMLIDQRGGVELVASSSGRSEHLELFQLQSANGPCLDAISAAEPVREPDLEQHPDRWPEWSKLARGLGIRSVYATPMKLRAQTIGALNLFAAQPRALTEEKLAVVRALADIATIGILQERSIRRSEILSEQLQIALNSRVLIEQAKGIVAGRSDLHVSVDRAFLLLRDHSRRTNTKLGVVAQRVVDGTLDPAQLVPSQRRDA